MEWKRCRNCGICYSVLLANGLTALTVAMALFSFLRIGSLLFALSWISALLFYTLWWLPRYCQSVQCRVQDNRLLLTRGVWHCRQDRVALTKIVGIAMYSDVFGRLWQVGAVSIYTTGGRIFVLLMPEEWGLALVRSWEAARG